jgi:plastocyanin domain-containing protein
MGKVEIKIRKKILTPDNLRQYRNYPALLKKYERTKRFKRALRIFIFSLALTMFVLALIFLSMWKVLLDKEQEQKNQKNKAPAAQQDSRHITP